MSERDIVDSRPQFGYGFRSQIGSGLFLLRQLIDMSRTEGHPSVLTTGDLPPDHPWFLSYLATFGNHPVHHPDKLSRNYIAPGFGYSDVVPVRAISDEAKRSELGATDILDRLRERNSTTAVALTLSHLSFTTGPLNLGFPSSQRIHLGTHAAARRFGPNLVVVYEQESVEDLALIWYLRALHGLPNRMPLAVPADADVTEVLDYWDNEQAYKLWGFDGGEKAVLSASVHTSRLMEMVKGTSFSVVTPNDVLQPTGGCGLFSTQSAFYSDGYAEIPRFVPTELEAVGSQALNTAGGWSTVTAVVKDDVLPPSRTLRRDGYPGRGYLRGYWAQSSTSDSVLSIHHPTGLETLTALARDHGQTVRPSNPGRAASQFIDTVGGQDGMRRLASPTIVELLFELTRGRNRTVISRQLRQFLKIDDTSESKEKRYQQLEERLDMALAQPDVEDTAYKPMSAIRSITKLSPSANKKWVRWAHDQGLLLRGFEAKCAYCDHKQWRPLADLTPGLTCHGCARTIVEPLGVDTAQLRYRSSETVLRAMNSDVLSHVLAIRYLVDLWETSGSGGHSIFGVYPGLELLDPRTKQVVAEADVAIILANGQWVVGECKTTARGLRESDFIKLTDFADRVDAAATFVATLDQASECDDLWKQTTISAARPHFTLTAEHLFDLHPVTPAGYDPLEWRSQYRNQTSDTSEDQLPRLMSDFLERSGLDKYAFPRAPWMKRPSKS